MSLTKYTQEHLAFQTSSSSDFAQQHKAKIQYTVSYLQLLMYCHECTHGSRSHNL